MSVSVTLEFHLQPVTWESTLDKVPKLSDDETPGHDEVPKRSEQMSMDKNEVLPSEKQASRDRTKLADKLFLPNQQLEQAGLPTYAYSQLEVFLSKLKPLTIYATPTRAASGRAKAMPPQSNIEDIEDLRETLSAQLRDVPDHVTGTCEWIAEVPEYIQWEAGTARSKVLAILAGPGLGKSVAAKFIDGLVSDKFGRQKTLTFFCTSKIAGRDSVQSALASFIYFSLVDIHNQHSTEKSQHLLQEISKEWTHKEGEISLDLLWRVLLQIGRSVPEAGYIFIIDGLDECDDKSQTTFRDLLLDAHHKLENRLLIMSRPTGNAIISREVPVIAFRPEQISRGLKAFVSDGIARRNISRYINNDLQLLIHEKVLEGADGFFLFCACRMDEIKKYITTKGTTTAPEDIERVIKRPFGPVSEYLLSLMNPMIESNSRDFGVDVLNILLAAQEPMTNEILTFAYTLSKNPGVASLKEYEMVQKRPFILGDAQNVCGSIVRVQGDLTEPTSRISILHTTVRELLEDRSELQVNDQQKDCLRSVNSLTGHRALAMACLKYLLLTKVEDPSSSHFEEEPFLLYSLRHWPKHVRLSENGISDFLNLFATFISSARSGYAMWAKWWSRVKDLANPLTHKYEAQPIAITVIEHSLTNVLGSLSRVGTMWYLNNTSVMIDLNSLLHGFSPVRIAIQKGDKVQVQQLLELGANLRIGDHRGVYPIHVAVGTQSEDLVRLCHKHGADLDVESNDYIASDGSTSYGQTPLITSITHCADEVQMFRLLYSLGARKMIRTGDGHTALHFAAAQLNLDLVKFLVEENALSVDSQAKDGSTALIVACETPDSVPIIDYLVQVGMANVKLTDAEGRSPLMATISSQNYPAAGYLMCLDSVMDQGHLNDSDSLGFTALHYASLKGFDDVVEILVKRQVSLDAVSSTGSTALHLAASEGHLNIVRILLKAGAKPDEVDNDGDSPLLEACRSGFSQITEALLLAGAKTMNCETRLTSLHLVAFKQREALAQMLMASSSLITTSINSIHTGSNMTPIHVATRYGTSRIALMFLKAGANLSITTDSGWTALHFACYYSTSIELIENIIHSTPSHLVDSQASSGSTPLSLAAEKGFTMAVRHLLQQNCNVLKADKSLRTPLMYAVHSGSSETVRLFLTESSRAFDQRDERGWTALHYAAALCTDPYVIRTLFLKTRWQNRSRSALTPVQLATFNRNVVALEVLLNHGMPPDFCSEDGKTALYHAAELEDPRCLQLLLEHKAKTMSTTAFNVCPWMLSFDTPSKDAIEFLRPADTVALSRKADTIFTNATIEAAKSSLQDVKWLVDNNINPCVVSITGETILHCAANRGQSAILHYLVNLPHVKRLINSRTRLSLQTPLHYAAAVRNNECVRVLLIAGADSCLADFQGLLPLDYIFIDGSVPETTNKLMCKMLVNYMSAECLNDWISGVINGKERTDNASRVVAISKYLVAISPDDSLAALRRNQALLVMANILLALKDHCNALTAFELEYGLPSPRYSGDVECNLCARRRSNTPKLVCTVCPWTAFCIDCKANAAKLKHYGCGDHELLKVPSDQWLERSPNHVNDSGQSQEEWLEGLEKTYYRLSNDNAAVLPTIHWEYDVNRPNVFDICKAKHWNDLRTHLASFPGDVALKDALGYDLVMVILRQASDDRDCLTSLTLLRHEGAKLLVHSMNTSSITLACERQFRDTTMFLLSQYDVAFNRQEDKSSSSAVTTMLHQGWSSALTLALERHFEWISRGSFHFLKDLDTFHTDTKSMIRYLQNRALRQNSSQERAQSEASEPLDQLSTNERPRLTFHRPFCTHHADMTEDPTSTTQSTLDGDDEDTAVSEPSRSKPFRNKSLDNNVARLCGLDRIFSMSTTGTLENVPEGNSLVEIRFGHATTSEESILAAVIAMQEAMRGLLQATWAAQDELICCDGFTVIHQIAEPGLRMEGPPTAKLSRISYALMTEFLIDLGLIKFDDLFAKSTTNQPLPGVSSARKIRKICEFSLDPVGTNKLSLFSFCCETLQFLCLAFLSFTAAHRASVQRSIFGASMSSILLRGLGNEGSLCVHSMAMACVGDMVGDRLLIFSDSRQDELKVLDPSPRLHLLATCEDMLEIWGPGRYMLVQQAKQARSNCLALAIMDGVITLKSETASGQKIAHWQTLLSESCSLQDEDFRSTEFDNLRFATTAGTDTKMADLQEGDIETLITYDPDEYLLIGCSSYACPEERQLKSRGRCGVNFERSFKQGCTDGKVTNLETNGPFYAIATKQTAAGLNLKGLIFTKTIGQNLEPQTSRKAVILKAWKENDKGMHEKENPWNPDDFVFLNEPHGVIFSICNGFAKRVPLRHAVAQAWPYLSRHYLPDRYCRVAAWEDMIGKLPTLMSGEGCGTSSDCSARQVEQDYERYIIDDLDRDKQLFVHRVILKILQRLNHSGVSSNGVLFKISWPRPDSSREGYIFPCRNVKAGWVGFLRDSMHLATFAVVSRDCLIARFIDNDPCRYGNGRIARLRPIDVFDTRVEPFRAGDGMKDQERYCLVNYISRDSLHGHNMQVLCLAYRRVSSTGLPMWQLHIISYGRYADTFHDLTGRLFHPRFQEVCSRGNCANESSIPACILGKES